MRNNTDVIVVGQGIVGLCAAIAMEKLGFNVISVDAKPAFTKITPEVSRIYAINNASITLLKTLNVWHKLEKNQISPYNRMHVWQAKTGAKIEFDSRICACDKLGVMLEETHLKHALYEEAKNLKIQFINNFSVARVVNNPQDITISSTNSSYTAKLLIIADGAKSPLREKLGIKITSWPYHQNAIIANIRTTKPHQQTAYQVFTTDGPLAFLPQKDMFNCSIVWSVAQEKAAKLIAFDADLFAKQITSVSQNKLGTITLASPRQEFTLQMRHTHQYFGERWILMGDAAHTIHPLAGLGLNIGLADLNTWIFELNKTNKNLDSVKPLRNYHRQRKNSLWKIIGLMQAFHILFTNDSALLSKIIGLGLNIFNNLTMLKKLIIEQASGNEL